MIHKIKKWLYYGLDFKACMYQTYVFWLFSTIQFNHFDYSASSFILVVHSALIQDLVSWNRWEWFHLLEKDQDSLCITEMCSERQCVHMHLWSSKDWLPDCSRCNTLWQILCEIKKQQQTVDANSSYIIKLM